MKKEEINSIVWQACDTFRGKIDPAQYKDYILTMLFVKFLSDVWAEKRDEYYAKYKGNETRIAASLKTEIFQLPDESSFNYLYMNRHADNIGELINKGLAKLENANAMKLEGVFRNIDFDSETNLGRTKDRNRILLQLLEDYNKLDLQPSHLENQDVLGDSYEYLISRFASDAGKKAGEFYTPKQISALLAQLVQPQPGDRVCDPACGSGSLLIRVAKEVKNGNISLFGQELNGSTWALAKMNMFLHWIEDANIEWGDSLQGPRLLDNDQLRKFDIVVANPPFSLDKWGAETAANDRFNRYHRGVPPKSKGDYAFISHMVETMHELKGRAGVIVPHGVLFRGSSEGTIRQALIDENLLDAVIGLPANLFFGTGIPAVIVLYRRGKTHKDVLFIDASQDFEPGKNQNTLRESDIAKIVATYQAYQQGTALDPQQAGVVLEERYAYRATLADIQANNYNLNIPRYVDTYVEEAPINLVETQHKITQLKAELAETEAKMNGYLKQLGLV